jgi:hypothetical protein
MTPDLLSYFFICFLRYPTIENVFLQVSYGAPGNPNIEKASLEHFFSSVSLPRARKFLSHDPEVPLIKILSVYGCTGWFKGNPFLALLNHYLEYFLPVTPPLENQQISQSQYLVPEGIGNLFLRLLIDFWIDTSCLIRSPTERSLQQHLTQTPGRHLNHLNCVNVFFLDSTPSTLPTRHTLQCIYVVIVHLIAETSPRNPVPTAISLLQQPVFDLLRALFARFTSFLSSLVPNLLLPVLWWIRHFSFLGFAFGIFG